jgi:hypothetical protein
LASCPGVLCAYLSCSVLPIVSTGQGLAEKFKIRTVRVLKQEIPLRDQLLGAGNQNGE